MLCESVGRPGTDPPFSWHKGATLKKYTAMKIRKVFRQNARKIFSVGQSETCICSCDLLCNLTLSLDQWQSSFNKGSTRFSDLLEIILKAQFYTHIFIILSMLKLDGWTFRFRKLYMFICDFTLQKICALPWVLPYFLLLLHPLPLCSLPAFCNQWKHEGGKSIFNVLMQKKEWIAPSLVLKAIGTSFPKTNHAVGDKRVNFLNFFSPVKKS